MTCTPIRGPGRQRIILCTPDERLTVPNPDCPNADQHTPRPEGYIAWHTWAATMSVKHKQRRCPGCGLLNIWTPRGT